MRLKAAFLLPLLLAGAAHAGIDKVPNGTITADFQPVTLRTVGRVAPVANGYRHQWPGVYFEGVFAGTAVYARFDDARSIYHISIDDGPAQTLSLPGRREIRIDGLEEGPHTIRVESVSEWQAEAGTFGGIFVPAGETAMAPMEAPARQMEFIGDSVMAGHGDISPDFTCNLDQIRDYSDASQAFGAVTARHYQADYQIVAASGLGVVRNGRGWPGPTVPQLYPFVLFDGKQPYDFAGWEPQVVVIMLGANDFSTALGGKEKWKSRKELLADYIATYAAFIKALRQVDPGASIIVMESDSTGDTELFEADRKVIAAVADPRVVLLPMHEIGTSGCNGHPSAAEHRAIAQVLIDYIDKHPTVWGGT